MQVSIRHRPSYSMAYLMLAAGEQVFVERQAMAAMSSGVAVRATTGGSGVAKALARKAVGGEGFVFSCFRAELYDTWVAVTPAFPGDIEAIEVDPDTALLLQTGSLLAYSEGVDVSLRYGGMRGVVMQEGIAFLRLGGEGQAVISSYGAIEHLAVGSGEELVVDSGHLVAFSEHMSFKLELLGSAATSALTGEGVVARFTGPGEVILQTRAERDLRSWLLPDRRHNERRR
jgi:uncharacterized protein (TIGR00266 family)